MRQSHAIYLPNLTISAKKNKQFALNDQHVMLGHAYVDGPCVQDVGANPFVSIIKEVVSSYAVSQ
jgi:hypothetical protein